MIFGKKKKQQVQTPNQPQAKQVTPISKELAKVEKGMISLADIIAPSSVEVDFHYIRVGETYYKTFFVVGYPRYVSANWLQP
ncbi:MAG: hypothetical protein COX78_01190, partial [Candidatus Levybacteria bacterium CG_4_10_14_0_2_um_filter_35_8]